MIINSSLTIYHQDGENWVRKNYSNVWTW